MASDRRERSERERQEPRDETPGSLLELELDHDVELPEDYEDGPFEVPPVRMEVFYEDEDEVDTLIDFPVISSDTTRA
jgi:hypothetical protein